MPLYDCMLLLKPNVRKEAIIDLVARVGKHVYQRNGVVTGMKSYGAVQLGYGIRKLDGRYYQGQLMQMTMMTPPSINSELHYLNKEDRLLRWLVIKHRGTNFMGTSEESDNFTLNGQDFRNALKSGGMFAEVEEDEDEDEDEGDDEGDYDFDDDDDDEHPKSEP